MAGEIMQRVQQAEAEAEAVRVQAQAEAREILKGVEEATLLLRRDTQVQNREDTQAALAQARMDIEKEIAAQQRAEADARAAMRAAAERRVDNAAKWIFERVVTHGNR